ncbi:MAG: glycosyltransferase family 4 protein [Alphaproteobacteria bacterium]|nr:glycosyltransferase family 4 protein [Alphaproteobacteria bacterium]
MGVDLPRVAFLSSRPAHGGSQEMLLQLAAGHAARGGHAHVLAPGAFEILERARARGLPATALPLHEGLAAYGGALVRMPRWKLALRALRGGPPFVVRLAAWLRRERIDVLYVAEARAGLLALPSARLVRVPLLLHAQGGPADAALRLTRAVVLRADRVLAVSEAVREDLHARLPTLDRGRTAVMYNGLPDQPPPPPRPPADEVVALFLGRLSPEKGVHHLLDAVARLSPGAAGRLRLDVVGADPEGRYAAWLAERATQLGVADRVRFLGFRDDVPARLAACDLVVCPSVEDEVVPLPGGAVHVQWREGFCLAAAEAMRTGRAVVASDTYGLREVVDHGHTGLRVPVGDVDALADALEVLVADPSRRVAFGQAGRRRFVERFTLDGMLDAFERELAGMTGR